LHIRRARKPPEAIRTMNTIYVVSLTVFALLVWKLADKGTYFGLTTVLQIWGVLVLTIPPMTAPTLKIDQNHAI
jgi:hypothetical protein